MNRQTFVFRAVEAYLVLVGLSFLSYLLGWRSPESLGALVVNAGFALGMLYIVIGAHDEWKDEA